ncbi:MAG: dihydroorotase [Eubacteriales bacterium]|jgi:dihydroorotase
MKMDLKLHHIRLVDPSCGRDEVTHLYVKDGKVAAITLEELPATQVLDGTGLTAFPGLVDVHCHLRDPGLTYKEDVITGTQAAAAGGITTIFAMPNTKPVTDNEETIRYIQQKATNWGSAHVHVVPAMTVGTLGKEPADYQMYVRNGILAISDDGKEVADPLVMRHVLEGARQYNLVPVCHCDDVTLVQGGLMNEGEVSRRLGVPGNPAASETVAVARDILLAEYVGWKVHLQHLSCGTSIALVREAKKRGVQVTCETGPHYFTFTDEAVESIGPNARMNPPLRTARDRELILEGIADGTVDCIATDHAPHSVEEKTGPLDKTMNGIVGFETSFAASYTQLVLGGVVSFSRLIELMSTSPAKLMGLSCGTLQVGSPADIAVADLTKTWKVDASQFRSKGRNTPFEGMELTGRIRYTLLDGQLVYQDPTL